MHHEKYKEIHGYDKIVLITQSEHKKIHIRLRKEKKCLIPVKELQKISMAAYSLTQNKRTKVFTSAQGKYTRLYELIQYNPITEEIKIYSSFHGTGGHKLPRRDI